MRYKKLKAEADSRANLRVLADPKSILVVEDNIAQRELLSELLALNGYRVSSAENGKEALEQLDKTPIPPALILLDLSMPIMDGRAFLQRFRWRNPKIPVLVMTGEDSPAVEGAAAVLNKPVEASALFSFIKQCLS
jgi:two-component system, NtrC family, response regulator GlrR